MDPIIGIGENTSYTDKLTRLSNTGRIRITELRKCNLTNDNLDEFLTETEKLIVIDIANQCLDDFNHRNCTYLITHQYNYQVITMNFKPMRLKKWWCLRTEAKIAIDYGNFTFCSNETLDMLFT